MRHLPDLQISTLIENPRWLRSVVPMERNSGGSTSALPAERTLKQLFQNVPVLEKRGPMDAVVRAVITDSRRVSPGSLFFAREGRRTDGLLYVEEAIDRGAVGIVSSGRPGIHQGVAFLRVDNVARTLAQVSGEFYGWPDRELWTAGVTGTNGKTTVSWLAQDLLRDPDAPVGLVGTVHYDLGGRTVPSFRTTPESVDTFSMLAQMRTSGCRAAVLEVSSHGIDQDRVTRIDFDAAVFLNLSRDHLDYHQTMEEYFAVKRRLFTGEIGPPPRTAVINLDDPRGPELVAALAPGTRALTFSEGGEAVLRASDIRFSRTGLRFTLGYEGRRLPVKARLAGRFNVRNILAALGLALAAGRDLEDLVRRLAAFPGVPGRLEAVSAGQAFPVFVDYAHTDDALLQVLETVREITPGRILLVFGCGGDRDRTKRPHMVHVAQTYADLVWATADNPRGESLDAIFTDMRRGVSKPDRIHFVDDRREAIHAAITEANPEDTVLIAGKGHEPFMEFADTILPFDDRLVARELLEIGRLRP